jgi:hypothetical protein
MASLSDDADAISWTIDDVVTWVETTKHGAFKEYAAGFRASHVDGEKLLQLSYPGGESSSLLKDIGVTSPAHGEALKEAVIGRFAHGLDLVTDGGDDADGKAQARLDAMLADDQELSFMTLQENALRSKMKGDMAVGLAELFVNVEALHDDENTTSPLKKLKPADRDESMRGLLRGATRLDRWVTKLQTKVYLKCRLCIAPNSASACFI